MKKNLLILILIVAPCFVHAQDREKTATTAAMFLNTTPDAKGTALGNTGAATQPDVSAQYWNPAKYAFITNRGGIGLNYSPGFKNISDGAYDAYLSGFFRFDNLQTISASVRYLSYGDEIAYRDESNQFVGNYKPNDWAIDIAYSRRFGEHWSGAVAFRYVQSNITGSFDPSMHKGWAVVGDAAVYYTQPTQLFGQTFEVAAGINVSNIGSKMSYSDDGTSENLPMNLRLGGSIGTTIASDHRLNFSLDFNKLLVNSQADDFGDAIKEITTSVGIEYKYMDWAALRCGYYEQSTVSGAGSFFAVGAGLAYKMVQIDAAYLIRTQYSSIFGNIFKISINVNF